jgi:tRNA threonylcarbamoyladenosine biosynthesis protein TsaE
MRLMPVDEGAADTSPMSPLSFVATTLEDTLDWGRRLGRALGVGDVIGLVGPLGAGKTTLTQAIAEGAGVPASRHVASPTFALVNEHPGRIPFVHADLYRVRSPAELAELGLDEAYDRAAAVIEWIDRFPEAAPADHLRVTLSPAPDGSRQVTAVPLGPSSARLLATL